MNNARSQGTHFSTTGVEDPARFGPPHRLPVIGLTTSWRVRTSAWEVEDMHTLTRSYVRAIEQAGGCPVMLAPVAADQVSVLLNRLDGLVLTGGDDISAAFGGTAHGVIDPARDEFERNLVIAAQRQRLPVLGICRGLHMAVVALGGSLIDDIPATAAHPLPRFTLEQPIQRHDVAIRPDSWLGQALGPGRRVNSRHHQAADRIPAALRVTARAADGIVEAVEAADPAWPMYAVQWHPEDLLDELSGSGELFAAFVACCR